VTSVVFWTLLAVGFASLFVTALGLPGLWIFIVAAIAAKLLVAASPIGWGAIVAATVVAGMAEGLEFWASLRYTRQAGGSNRAGWGALAGGIAGAIVGVPIPIIGSVIGSFVGCFLGALVAEWSVRREDRGDDADVVE
jgi:uncharacterized protein YqgC (DUF456 family)